jgi:hypothetical protein
MGRISDLVCIEVPDTHTKCMCIGVSNIHHKSSATLHPILLGVYPSARYTYVLYVYRAF